MAAKKKKGKKKTKSTQTSKEQRPPIKSAADAENQDSNQEENSGGENYSAKLRELMDPWRFLASDGREEGHKSLSEVLRELDLSGDTDMGTRMALAVAGLGIRISRLIVEYFSVFWRYEAKELAAKALAAANTIRQLSLQGQDNLSAITDRFVAVIEMTEREIKFPKHYNDCDSNVEEDHIVWVSGRENQILGTIFYRVLFLEILFCFPFFSGATASEKKDSAARIRKFVAKESGFEEKLKELESMIAVLKEEELENEKHMVCNDGWEYNEQDPETLRRNAIFGSKIEEIWKGLDRVDALD